MKELNDVSIQLILITKEEEEDIFLNDWSDYLIDLNIKK